MYSKLDELNDQPSQYGLLLNIGHNTSEVHQLWLTQNQGDICHRGGNASGWGTASWVTMLDSNNYNTYVPKKDGTGASGTWGISISGTATKLATARTISLTGDVTGSASFDGSANASITATVADNSHNHTYNNISDLNFNICGINLLSTNKIQNHGCTTFTYDTATQTYTCIAPTGSGTWGYGITFSSSGRSILIPRGQTIIFSLEVYPTVACTWDQDTNNQYASGTASSGNDNDVARSSSSRQLVANKWQKCWFSYTAPDDRDLIDANSSWGIVTTDLTADITFYLRNIQAQVGNIPTSFSPPPWIQGDSVTGAVWNDYAEYRESNCAEYGRVLVENGDDTLSMSTERLQPFAGVSSDTWGFCQGETEKAKTPIAVAGRVLVYPYQNRDNYKPGDCVCSAPNGTVDIMTREEIIQYPDRIIGTVSCVPDYEEWGSGDREPAKVNGRIWIKVK